MAVILIVTTLIVGAAIAPGSALGGRFVVCPTSQIAPLDSTATFHCVVTGNFVNTVLQWFIDDLSHETIAIEARGISVTTNEDPVAGTINSTLAIPATLVNNMTEIFCRIFMVDDSSEVTLLIQGLLAPPSNLAIGHVDNYNQRLSWTPPFTLDITGVDPDVTYSVCCNVTTNCNSTTDPYYDFPTLCDPVEFTVTAVNPVGDSEPSSIVFDPIYVQRPTSISMMRKEVSFLFTTQPVVVFLFQTNGNCTGLYEAEFNGTYTGTVTFKPTIPTVNANGKMNLTYHTGLQPNDVYCGNITQQNSSDMMQETNFTTFDVQSSNSLEGRGGRISIICIFAEGSQARGCVVIISRLGAEPSVVKNKEASQEQGIGNATALFTGLPAGIYSVVILDIEEDGSIDTSRESLYKEVVIVDGPVMTSATSPTQSPTQSLTSIANTTPGVYVPDEKGSKALSSAAIGGLVGGALLLATVVIVITVISAVCFKMRLTKQTTDDNAEIAMKENCAYEGVQINQHRPQSNVNQTEPCMPCIWNDW